VTEPDAMIARIGEGIALRERGERVAARDLFAQVWSEIGGEDGDPFHRCALAHSMADVQDDVHEELAWDLRALAAADLLTDERAARGGVAGPVAGFYPSLHLNLDPPRKYSRVVEEGLSRCRRGGMEKPPVCPALPRVSLVVPFGGWVVRSLLGLVAGRPR